MSKQHFRRFSDQFERDSDTPQRQIIQNLQLLLDISRKVASYDILDQACETLEKILATALEAEKVFIYTHNSAEGVLTHRSLQGDLRSYINVGNLFDEIDRCFDSGESAFYNSPEPATVEGILVRNFACSLLNATSGGKLGVIQVVNKSQDFEDKDLQLLKTFGDHLGMTLEVVVRNEQANRAHEEELELLNVVADVTTELDLVSMIHKIIVETTRLLKAERATVFLYDKKNDELFSHVAIGLDSKEIRIPSGAGIAGEVFKTQKTINIPYAYADLRFNPAVDKATGFFTRSILCVPLLNNQSECIGVTQILNKKVGVFNKEDETRLKAFTTQIAVGIENAKLFNDIQNINSYIESMLQSMSNAVLTFDGDRKIITCNHAAEKLLQKDSVAVNKQSAESIFGSQNQWLLDALQRVNDKSESYDAVDVELKLEKRTSSVNLHIYPLISVEKEKLGTVVMLEDISKEKRLKTTMARYMDSSVADQLIDNAESKLGGQSLDATVLFTDIRNFTTISESLGPQGTVSFLNNFFTEMVACVQDNDGLVNKFIGDALLAVYGVPIPLEDEADKAVKSAVAMNLAMKVLNQKTKGQFSQQDIEIGVGINHDSIVYGNIGSPKRMDFTVIGDGVNTASRIESACKFYGSTILISENTFRKLKGTYRIREVDRVIVKGKKLPISLFEVLDAYSEQDFPNLLDVVQLTREGISHYRKRAWDQSMRFFNEVLKLHPKDKVAAIYLERNQTMKKTPPAEDWQGVWLMDEK